MLGRLPPPLTFSALLFERTMVTTPVAKLASPLSALPITTGVFAFGFGFVASSGTPNFPYTNDSAPVASVFIPTNQRSKSASGTGRCQTMYHWLLGGGEVNVGEGANCMVNTNLFAPPKQGSAMKSSRMFTRGSGGVLAPESLSLPSGLRSSSTRRPGGKPGFKQMFGPPTNIGVTLGQNGPSPIPFTAVT